MYSFYGGQKGQDFKISRIFANRSFDLLEDLEARWFSPVNVGDYVLISYGDISKQNKIIIKDDNVTEQLSSYNNNLQIDLTSCGRSYNNTLWQKVYVDENRTLSPSFPESEENLYIFLNFVDTIEEMPIEQTFVGQDVHYYNLNYLVSNKDSIKITWHNFFSNNNINFKLMYDEQFNRIYFIDESNNDEILALNNKYSFTVEYKTTYLTSVENRGINLKEVSNIYTEENYGFGYKLIACLTGQTPKLDVSYYVHDISDGDPSVHTDLTVLENPKIRFHLQKAQELNTVSTNVISPLQAPSAQLVTSGKHYVNNKLIESSRSKPILKLDLPRAVQYFSGPLFGEGDINKIGISIYHPSIYSNSFTLTINELYQKGIANQVLNYFFLYNLKPEYDASINKWIIENEEDEFLEALESTVVSIESQENKYINDFKPYLSLEQSLRDLLGQYLPKSEESKESRAPNSPITDLKLPWDQYGLKNNFTYNDLQNHIIKLNEIQDLITIILKEEQLNINDLKNYWGTYGLITENEYLLMTPTEKKNYLRRYKDGYENQCTLVMLNNILSYNSKGLNVQELFGEIEHSLLTKGNSKYALSEEFYIYLLNFFEQFNSQIIYEHITDLYTNSMQGDFYLNIYNGSSYKIIEKDDKKITVKYLGTFTGPAPSVDVQSIDPYTVIKDENGEDIYENNSISLNTNILNGVGTGNKSKETYVFSIPALPDFKVGQTESLSSTQQPSVNTEKTNKDFIFNFNIPKAVQFYQGSNTNTVIKKALDGDYFINTSNSKDRGKIYQYYKPNKDANGEWIEKGSLLGPSGFNKIQKNFKVTTSTISEAEKSEGYYQITELDAMTLLSEILESDFSLLPPISNDGEAWQIETYNRDNNSLLELSQTYWLFFNYNGEIKTLDEFTETYEDEENNIWYGKIEISDDNSKLIDEIKNYIIIEHGQNKDESYYRTFYLYEDQTEDDNNLLFKGWNTDDPNFSIDKLGNAILTLISSSNAVSEIVKNYTTDNLLTDNALYSAKYLNQVIPQWNYYYEEGDN